MNNLKKKIKMTIVIKYLIPSKNNLFPLLCSLFSSNCNGKNLGVSTFKGLFSHLVEIFMFLKQFVVISK